MTTCQLQSDYRGLLRGQRAATRETGPNGACLKSRSATYEDKSRESESGEPQRSCGRTASAIDAEHVGERTRHELKKLTRVTETAVVDGKSDLRGVERVSVGSPEWALVTAGDDGAPAGRQRSRATARVGWMRKTYPPGVTLAVRRGHRVSRGTGMDAEKLLGRTADDGATVVVRSCLALLSIAASTDRGLARKVLGHVAER